MSFDTNKLADACKMLNDRVDSLSRRMDAMAKSDAGQTYNPKTGVWEGEMTAEQKRQLEELYSPKNKKKWREEDKKAAAEERALTRRK
jgi:hypothetical protein